MAILMEQTISHTSPYGVDRKSRHSYRASAFIREFTA